MIIRENKNYWIISKCFIGYVLIFSIIVCLFSLSYGLLSLPKTLRIGINPKISELESEVDLIKNKLSVIEKSVVYKSEIMPSVFKGEKTWKLGR